VDDGVEFDQFGKSGISEFESTGASRPRITALRPSVPELEGVLFETKVAVVSSFACDPSLDEEACAESLLETFKFPADGLEVDDKGLPCARTETPSKPSGG